MKNSRSEVFDELVKIAQDKGMISEDAPEKAKKKLDKNPRWDSLDISAIEALYGVKPDAPKDMNYTRNIIEDAHPNSVIVSPAYDKLNGLVENNNERQDIILHILDKTPNGQLTNHKYAEKELLMSLIRVGNDMDNKNHEDLRVLADTCLYQMSGTNFEKKAAFMPIIAGAAAVIGALYLQQHLPMVNEGFKLNHKKLISELDDLLNASSDWGVGSSYSSTLKNMVIDFKNKLNQLYAMYERVEPIIRESQKPRTAVELQDFMSKQSGESFIKAYKTMSKIISNLDPYLKQIAKNFSSEVFKAQETTDKGFFTSLIDKTQVLHGGKGLFADDFDDVVRALAPYQKSVQDLLSLLQKSESIESNANKELENAVATANNSSNKVNKKDPELEKLEQDAASLGEELSSVL